MRVDAKTEENKKWVIEGYLEMSRININISECGLETDMMGLAAYEAVLVTESDA